MKDQYLQMYLLACVVVSMAILLLWGMARKKLSVNEPHDPLAFSQYHRIKRVSLWFWLIFSAFILMVVIYSIVPDLYFVFFPLDVFHHPLINNIGILVTKLAIAWIVVAQLHIDKELYKYLRDMESLSAMELLWYSEGKLLAGMLFLFVGISITITNVVGLFLVVTCLIIFIKIRRSVHRNF